MIRLLLEMLLPLGCKSASPTEVHVALGTLDVAATTFQLGDRDATLGVRTAFGAVLEVELVEDVLALLIFVYHQLDRRI